jgi:hypothetical protein
MKVRRVFGLIGTAALLSLGFASAAHADGVNYPPTTSSQHVEGSTIVSTPTTVDGPQSTKSNPADGGLPFTGGNDSALVWVGVAAVGTGTFAAWRFRHRTRVS